MPQHDPLVCTRQHQVPTALLVTLLFLASCAVTPGAHSVFNSDVDFLIARGEYEGAVRMAAFEAAADPTDAVAEAAHRRATVAWHLEKGRRATFADRDMEALQWFDRARELEPGSDLIASWIGKTRRKVAREQMALAAEALAGDDLQKAVLAYASVLTEDPQHADAQAGLDRVLGQMEYREGMADDYYRTGVDALADHWLEQARAHFSYANKYREGDEHTARRRADVDQLIAGQRMALGGNLELHGHYHAARVEYLSTLKLDPSNTEAELAATRMTREAGVLRDMEKARMALMRDDFEDALALLLRAEAVTDLQGDAVAGLMDEVDATRTEARYLSARSLERDHRFEAARDAYAVLLADVSYYDDALARHATLVDYIEEAAELYDKAADTSDASQRRSFLLQINLFWPEYRDVADQLAP